MDGEKHHQAQGQPILLVTPFPSATSTGVGHRGSGHSIVTSVSGHKYTGSTLLSIYNCLINLTQASVLGIKSRKMLLWRVGISWKVSSLKLLVYPAKIFKAKTIMHIPSALTDKVRTFSLTGRRLSKARSHLWLRCPN